MKTSITLLPTNEHRLAELYGRISNWPKGVSGFMATSHGLGCSRSQLPAVDEIEGTVRFETPRNFRSEHETVGCRWTETI